MGGEEGRHEGHEEGHEGKEGERHRQGQKCQVCCLQGRQGEDCYWDDQGQAHQEQEWQDRVQGSIDSRQEELGELRSQEVGWRCQGGTQGLEPHGLRCYWWQVGNWQGALRQGQGAAQVNKAACVRSCCPRWASSAWLSRGEAISGRCMRCQTLYIISCPVA